MMLHDAMLSYCDQTTACISAKWQLSVQVHTSLKGMTARSESLTVRSVLWDVNKSPYQAIYCRVLRASEKVKQAPTSRWGLGRPFHYLFHFQSCGKWIFILLIFTGKSPHEVMNPGTISKFNSEVDPHVSKENTKTREQYHQKKQKRNIQSCSRR